MFLVCRPGLAAPGLVATYFNNAYLTPPAALVRVDSTVNFDWASGSPAAAINADNFSARWTGVVRVATTGAYTFQTVSDDGVRLWVNGALVIDNWTQHAATANNSAAITLTAGVDYAIKLEWFEWGGLAVMQLNWKKPGDAGFSTIPASNGSLGLATGTSPLAEFLFEEPAWAGTSGEVNDNAGGWDGTAGSLSSTRPTTASASPAVGTSSGTCRYGVFNRANKDYIALPSAFPDLATLGSFTVTAWIRTTDRTAAGQRIFIQDENGYAGANIGYIFSLGDRGAGKLNFLTRQTTASVDETITAAVVADNTWYFTAFGVDASTKRKFVVVMDAAGPIVANVSTTYTQSSIGSSTGVVSIGGETNAALGSENTSSFGFAGNLDEVRVFAGALTTTEIGTVRGLAHACGTPTLLAEYRFEQTGWNGSAGELLDTGGHASGPFHGTATGSPLPTPATASPALGPNPGTCGYASMPGPYTNGGAFTVSGLPVSTTAGAKTTLAFWMYWDGADNRIVTGMGSYDLWLVSGAFGFNTNNSDVYGIANASLATNVLWIDGVPQVLTQRYGSAYTPNLVASSTLTIGGYGANNSFRFSGRLDEFRIYDGALDTAAVQALMAATRLCGTLHHVEIRHASGTGLTCTPSTLTVVACQDAACATPYTGGLSGTLTASGTGMSVVWPTGAPFSIAAGSSSATEDLQVTTAGSVLLGASGLSTTPSNATTCNFGSPACTFTAADTGFLFDVPHHVADTANTVSVSAVRKADNANVCVPAFASASKSVTFKCGYGNPASGTLPVRVGGAAINSTNSAAAACDAGGRAVSLAFNASGVASTTVQYADVGQMTLTATYTGSGSDAGLVMSGSDSFIAAPASFAFSGITAAPIKAGASFAATVTARNASGTTTPNFGREAAAETATLAFARRTPTGTGSANGTFSGSLGAWSAGSATASTLTWSEVGTIDLSATLASGSYLGSGLTATGTTGTGGAVGRFTPHHFDVGATAACGAFSYAGQPFGVTVTARNAAGTTTVNYDGAGVMTPSYAKAVTLAEATALGVGSLSGASLAAGAFAAGVATSGAPAYTFTSKQTAPQSLVLRATDADAVSSAGYTEPTMALRSGRLRLANAFGAETRTLQVAVATDYWSGNAWLVNSADGCTTVPAAAVAQSNKRDRFGNATTAWSTSAGAVTLAAGQGSLALSAPGVGNTGTLDLAINLGSTAADQSCLATHPASTGAGLAWLRSRNGSCVATWDRDPAARASFGIYAPETRKTIHARDVF